MTFLDRIKETSTSTGTGTFTLGGAVLGYKVFTNGTYKYCIVNETESEWEVGEGTVASGVLTRTTIEASSNGGATVSFSAGTKYVFNTVSAAYVNSLVPYTGATASVNLGAYGITSDYLQLSTTPTASGAVGRTLWNDQIGSTETTLKGGSVVLKNGVDLVARVVNKVTPAATLTKATYKAVRVSGAQGQRLAIAYAQANNDNNSADTIGLVCETIAANQEGFIITVGQLTGINTTGSLQGETWADGDVLYLSPTTAGNLTNIKPTGATGHIVVIGYVEYSHAINGSIYVKIMNGWELDELHNVYINAVANNDVLMYESSSTLWKNKSIATILGYTPADDSLVVHLAGAENITGVKTFQNAIKTTTGDNLLNTGGGNTYVGYTATTGTPQKLNVYGNTNIEFTANRYLYFGVRSGYADIAEISTTNATYLRIIPNGPLWLFPQDASSTIVLGSNLTKQTLSASTLYGTGSTAGYGFSGGTNAAQVWKANVDSGGGIIGNFIFHGSDYGAFAHRVTASTTALHTIKTTGQLQLHNYTSTSVFTGTVAGLLGFDSSGNVITTSASGGGISGSGTAGQVTYWSGTSAVTGSSSLTFSNNGFIINTNISTSLYKIFQAINTFDTQVDIKTQGTNNAALCSLSSGDGTTSGRYAYFMLQSLETTPQRWDIGLRGNKNLVFYNSTLNSAALSINSSTNNVLINTTTDGGQRLQVIGSMRVGTTAATAMYWDDTNNRLGIGTSSPGYDLDILKNLAGGQVTINAKNSSSSGNASVIVNNSSNDYNALEIFGSSYSIGNLQRKGTFTCSAPNGFSIMVYSNATTAHFSITTTTSFTERFRVFGNTGNVLIQNGGTFTDGGYRLDVQGTMRATGQVRLSGLPTSATGLSAGDLWNNSGVINIV